MGKLNNAVYAMNHSTHSKTRPAGICAADLLTPPQFRTRPGAPKESCEELIERTVLHYQRYRNKRNESAIIADHKPRFRVGDHVRTSIEPNGSFSKISDPQWGEELYVVKSIVRTVPLASYRLAIITQDGVEVPLNGSFSEIRLKRG